MSYTSYEVGRLRDENEYLRAENGLLRHCGMPVVRAAMAEESARVRMARAEHGIGDFAALESEWLRRVEATRVAVKAYRKAGGK